MTAFVGFDIGGTSVKYGLVDEKGQILEKGSFETTPEDGEQLLAKMTQQVKTYQANQEILSVGVSVPGIVRKDGYMVTAGAIHAFQELNLKEKCEAAFGLPVVVQNDANCAAIAEQWIGNAKGIENYVVIVLGTAVGCGIIINNAVYQGAHGAAGEIGWTMQGPLDFSQDLEAGSWNFTSGVVLGLYQLYQRVTGQEVTDARVILDLAKQGDPQANQVLNQYLDDVAKGLLNLVCAFDPEVILLGGGISANDAFLNLLSERLEKIKAHHKSLHFLTGVTVADVKPCALRNDAGLIGAVYQAKQLV